MIKVSENPKKEDLKGEAEIHSVPLISLNISTISLDDSIQKISDWGMSHTPAFICFANVHMLVEAQKDTIFRSQVNKASLVLPDGKPIVQAIRGLYNMKLERKAGMDYLPFLLRKADANKASIFIYGSSTEIQNAMIKRIRVEYPNVQVVGNISPPFTNSGPSDIGEHIRLIRSSGANFVLVSLGCPKQEKWMADYTDKIPAVLLGVGGAFGVFAGVHKRAPVWMQKYSLEWFYRLIQEPRRMFTRYLYTNTFFLFLLAKKIIRR